MSPLLAAWFGVAVAILAAVLSTYWSVRTHRSSRATNLEPHYASLSEAMDAYQVLVRPNPAELIRRHRAGDDDPVKREAENRARATYEEVWRHLALLGMSDDVAGSYQHWVSVVEQYKAARTDSACFGGDGLARCWAHVERANARVVSAMREHLHRLTHSALG